MRSVPARGAVSTRFLIAAMSGCCALAVGILLFGLFRSDNTGIVGRGAASRPPGHPAERETAASGARAGAPAGYEPGGTPDRGTGSAPAAGGAPGPAGPASRAAASAGVASLPGRSPSSGARPGAASPAAPVRDASETAAGGIPSSPSVPSRPAPPGSPPAPGSVPTTEMAGGRIVGLPAAPVPPAVAPAAERPGEKEKENSKGTTDSDEDATPQVPPPDLASLNFNPAQIRAGGTSTLTVQLTGELTGQTTISGMLVSPSGKANFPFAMSGDGAAANFAAPIVVPPQSEAGAWYISVLSILNQSSFFLSRSFTAATVPPGGSLRVTSDEADTTPPEIRAVTVEKYSVRDGEKNRVMVDTVDEQSGIASVKGAFQSPSKSALSWFACVLNPDTNQWEGDVPIPPKAECGEWTLQQVRVIDTANNQTVVTGEMPAGARAAFSVAGTGECDDTAPSLDSLVLSPTVVSNETDTAIQVTAIVRDVGSGTMSVFGYATPENPGTTRAQIYFALSQDPKDPESPWVGKILVPRAAAKGTWKITFFHTEDHAHNARNYGPADPQLANISFVVE